MGLMTTRLLNYFTVGCRFYFAVAIYLMLNLQSLSVKAEVVTPTLVPLSTPAVTPVAIPIVTPLVTPTVVPLETPTVTPLATPTVTPIVISTANENKPDKSGFGYSIGFYQLNGHYDFTTTSDSSPATAVQERYEFSNYNFMLFYRFNEEFRIKLNNNYRQKLSKDFDLMDNKKQIGRYQEYGLLDPSLALSYKKNIFSRNQTLWFTTKYSQSMGPKIQKTLDNGILQGTSRVGYSYSENTLSYDNSEYPLGFGTYLTYRSNYLGKKRKNEKLSEFDPEKWITTGANIYYPINKYSIGTSASIYRPAYLNGRDYHNKLIGVSRL